MLILGYLPQKVRVYGHTLKPIGPKVHLITKQISKQINLNMYLKALGKDYAWLHSQLKIHNVRTPEEVFLATCDHDGAFEVYQNSDETPCGDIIN